MKLYHIISSLFVLSLATANADDVLVIDDSNFQAVVTKHHVLLVEFYAPWCGHCKRLEPEYSAAATELMNDDPPIRIAKVDCVGEGKDTCRKFSVSGFPTIKLFDDGKFSSEYDGGRTKDAIVKYMRRKAAPSSKLLESMADMEKFVSSKEPVVVGLFDDQGDKYKEFKRLADSNSDDFRFGHTLNADVLKKYEYTNEIVIFRPPVMKSKFEEQQTKHSSGDLHDWLSKQFYGLVGVRTSSNNNYFPAPLVTVFYKVDYVLDPKGTQYWRNRVMKVAQDFKDKFTFAVADKSEFSSELTEFGIDRDSGDEPRATIKNEKGQKFHMKEKFNMDSFRQFVQSYIDGKLEPYLKSEPVPEPNDEPVKVVVAKNFDEIVNDKTKDVLIEFYAPWCGHCKNLEPKYNELAEKLKDEENVVIAKMDATANDVPSPYNVRGFPTIYFAPKNSKDSPKQYQGGREVKDFLEYLARESTLTGFDKKSKKIDARKEEL